MIKFFRKIRQISLMENKTGKYLKYAIGEIALVMIGILLALQVNNWNNDRIQKQKEANYIEHINKEFLLNRVELDTATSFHFKVFNNATKIANLIPIDINTINKDSLSFYITETFHNYTFNPQQSTINSLTNTSSFEIISNLELRELLQNWDELVKDYREEEIISREYSFDNYFPYFRKHISFMNYANNNNIFNNQKIDYTFLNDLEFENAIAFKRELIRDIIDPSQKNELKIVSQTINRIIELTTLDR